MPLSGPHLLRRLVGSTMLVSAAAVALAAAPAAAQPSTPPAQPSTNATVNLIQLLVKNKVITKAAGDALLAQAEAEAAQARAALAQNNAGAGVAAGAAVAALPPPTAGSIRVPYIPESVRAEITAGIKNDVLATAKAEGWASARQIPDWLSGVTLYGDVRFRNESAFYSDSNTPELIDFENFNARGPIDINPNTNPSGFPLLNTRTTRESRFRLRARLGLKAQINDYAQIGFRIATGDDRSPISTNQLLGGGLAKKEIWLDQAYIKVTPTDWVSATFGRFTNPFHGGDKLFDVAELIFDNDLNFDGVAVTATADQWLPENTHLSVTGGAFPLGYANPDFPSNLPDKAGDGANKWLFSGQLRAGYEFGERGIAVEGGAAYHSFKGAQGQLSAPCTIIVGDEQCSTDQFQPVFLRKGNTLFFLRDIAADPASPNNFAQPQLLGLAFDYDVLELNASVTVPVTDKLKFTLEGDYINNVGYDKNDICRFAPKGLPINNITVADPIAGALPGTPGANFYTNPCTPDAAGRIARLEGGNQGYLIRGVFGTAEPRNFGEWNVQLSYRYIESDATLDSFADSDFHFGGTNAKGYSIGGSFGLAKGLIVTGRWLSANEISGPPLAIDVLQFDLVAKF